MIGELLQHPLSAAFPAMSEADQEALRDDIEANGQRDRGVVFEGMVLDGWHRYQACRALGIAFKFDEFDGKDPVSFVLSRNLHRRHLTASQRAAAVVAATNWRPHGDQKSRSAAAADRTTAEMAKVAEVSTRTIENAKAAHKAGLGEAVKDGRVTAERAAEVAKLPEQEREKALSEPAPKSKPAEKGEVATLKARVEELEEALSDLAIEAEAAKIHEGEEGYRNIKAVLAELESVKRERNRYMNECAELKRQVKFLERDLKAARKA